MIAQFDDRVASQLQNRRALLVLFALGLVIRLILARHSEGLAFDVGLFREWSDRLVQRGPARFYETGYFADYPPGYLYVLFVLGKLSVLLRGEPPSVGVLKLPAIIADLGVALFAGLLAARLTRRTLTGWTTPPVAAAAAILLNPGLILVSAVWGQVDSVLALLVLAGIYALAGPPGLMRELFGVALFAIAIATKPQAVLAMPILAIVLVRRHLRSDVPALRAWISVLARITLYLVFATAIVVGMFAPFGVRPAQIPGFYQNAGSVYRFTSLWAFNIWGVFGFYRRDVEPNALTVGGVPAYYIALSVFAVAVAALMVLAWRSLSRRVDAKAVALFGAVAVTCTAFALLTRMHERYLYFAVVGLAPFAAYAIFRRALALVSVLFFLNVHFVYVLFSRPGTQEDRAWTIGPIYNAFFGMATDAWQRKAFSVATAILCLAIAALGWRWLEKQNAEA